MPDPPFVPPLSTLSKVGWRLEVYRDGALFFAQRKLDTQMREGLGKIKYDARLNELLDDLKIAVY